MVVIGFILCLMLSNTIESKLAPTIRLNNGYEMPIIGLGTYKCAVGECERAVKDAIDIGFRHIDSAFAYENEVEVGNAVRAKLAEGVIKDREEVFITTKLWHTFNDPDQVETAFQRSFDNLNLSYIDLYLIHDPMSAQRILINDSLPADDVSSYELFPIDENGKTLVSDVDYIDTWRAMEKLVQSGRVRSIGVSNFNSEQIDRLHVMATVQPVTNQIECHPNLNQRKLIHFCAERNITVTAFSPLGRPNTLQTAGLKLAISDSKVLELGQKHRKTPAQIVLRYSIQNGAIVIPKSTNKKRIKENFDVFDFELSDDEMLALHKLNNNYRIFDFAEDSNSKYYPFNIEY